MQLASQNARTWRITLSTGSFLWQFRILSFWPNLLHRKEQADCTTTSETENCSDHSFKHVSHASLLSDHTSVEQSFLSWPHIHTKHTQSWYFLLPVCTVVKTDFKPAKQWTETPPPQRKGLLAEWLGKNVHCNTVTSSHLGSQHITGL